MKKNPFPTVFLTALLSWALTAGTLSAQPTGRQGASSYPPVPPSEREVGIAYGLWADRDLWSSTWDKPQIGEYDSRDRRVIRKHAEWLSDAGVDFVWLDWSNNVTYDPCKLWTGGKQDVIEDATAILFDEYRKMSEAGLPHPRISIFIGVTRAPEAAEDGRLQKKADQVWEMYAGNPRYREMMQLHEGKPLLVVYVDTPSPWQNGTPAWDDERFAVRWMTGYVSEQAPLRTDDRVSRYGYWSWEDRGEQTYPVRDGRRHSVVIRRRPQKSLFLRVRDEGHLHEHRGDAALTQHKVVGLLIRVAVARVGTFALLWEHAPPRLEDGRSQRVAVVSARRGVYLEAIRRRVRRPVAMERNKTVRVDAVGKGGARAQVCRPVVTECPTVSAARHGGDMPARGKFFRQRVRHFEGDISLSCALRPHRAAVRRSVAGIDYYFHFCTASLIFTDTLL